EPERTVELADVIEEDVQVERLRPGNAVLAMVGGEIVVPLPEVAAEGRLHIDLGLHDVEVVVAEDLPGRLDEAGMADELGIGRAAQMDAHGGAHLAAVLLAEVGGRVL